MAETRLWARLAQGLRTVRGGDMVSQPSHFAVCMLSRFTCIQPFATLWTVAHSSSVRGILQARILEWVAMPSSRGPSRRKDRTSVSSVGRQALYL